MKIKIIFAFISLSILTSFSLTAQDSGKWQQWRSTECYSKLFFRLKFERQHGKRIVSQLQFKNAYDRLVTFNYAVKEDEKDYLTTHRKTLQAGETGKTFEIVTGSESFFILVDWLSFSVDGSKAEPCDPD